MTVTAVSTDETSLTAIQAVAQRAILEEAEIQEIAKKLAQWGLGIAMPHMHTAKEDFAGLPDDIVQVETAGVVSFRPRKEAEAAGLIPVGWRWHDQGLTVVAGCSPFMYCNPNVAGHAHVSGHTNS